MSQANVVVNTNLVVPSVGTRAYLNSLSKVVRPAQEIGAECRQIFSVRVRVVALVFGTFTRRSGIVETDDEQRIVDKTQASGVCSVLRKCLAQPRPSLSVLRRENADRGAGHLAGD